MKIFISWSGQKARRVAKALRAFLQDVNQQLIPWFSDDDISAGQRWGLELSAQLEATNYGIVCVTQESLQKPWPMFEAGALSKSVKAGSLCPYLIDITRQQLLGPLSQFQAKEAKREPTWEMLQSINIAMPTGSLSADRLSKYFGLFWPSLEEEIRDANKHIKYLPQPIMQNLLDVIPKMFYRVTELEMYAADSDVPIWEVNLNQSALLVWSELIQVAVRENRLGELLRSILKRYPGNDMLPGLLKQVEDWETQS